MSAEAKPCQERAYLGPRLMLLAALFIVTPSLVEGQTTTARTCDSPSVRAYNTWYRYGPSFQVQGYVFHDANPFLMQIPKGTKADYVPEVGTPIDVEGKRRWMNAGIEVACWLNTYSWGLKTKWFSISRYYGGVIQFSSTGCASDATLVDYDPYDDGGEEGWGCNTSSGGTQYSVGDYTGGETIDFDSGIGNGGASACGVEAVVEYICIDLLNEAGEWVEYACGYVTTCT